MCEFERTGISERMEWGDYLGLLTLHCVGFGGRGSDGKGDGPLVAGCVSKCCGTYLGWGHVSEVVVVFYLSLFLRPIPLFPEDRFDESFVLFTKR